ncbi:hypothetical protein BB559_001674, partial [Furculomyces boomerangus]
MESKKQRIELLFTFALFIFLRLVYYPRNQNDLSSNIISHAFYYLLNIFLAFRSLSNLLSIIKAEALNYITPEFKKIVQPKIIKHELGSEFSQKDGLIDMMNKVDDSGRLNVMHQNVILGSKFLKEYSMLPVKVLNVFKGRRSFNRAAFLYKFLSNSRYKINIKIGSLLTTEKIRGFVGEESLIFQHSIESYIRSYGILEEAGTIHIHNCFDFISQAASKNAFVRFFGKNYYSDKKVQDAIQEYLNFNGSGIKSSLNIFEYISHYKNSRKMKKQFEYLQSYLKREVESRNQNQGSKKNAIDKDFIDLIRKHINSIFDQDYRLIVPSLLSFTRTYTLIVAQKLLNTLVDISVMPKIFRLLAEEQNKIIKKFGKSITLEALDSMEYLDAVIRESFRLSCPANGLHRQIQSVYVLSNGVTLKNETNTSFNLFTHLRNEHKFGKSAQEFNPETPISKGIKLKNNPKDEPIWGIG